LYVLSFVFLVFQKASFYDFNYYRTTSNVEPVDYVNPQNEGTEIIETVDCRWFIAQHNKESNQTKKIPRFSKS